MSEGDIFREVEEDLRREQLAKAWDRYGAYVIAAGFIIVALAIGYNFQKWRSAEQAAQGGESFAQAISLREAGKPDDGRKILQQLAEQGPGNYQTLAKLQLAADALENKDEQAAIEHYRAVAQDQAALRDFRDFATVQMMALQLEKASPEEMKVELEPLASGNSSFRWSAKELLALSAVRANKPDEAERIFGEILTDSQAPAQMRQRAEMMLSLLVRKNESGSAAAQPEGDGRNETQGQ